MYEPGDILVRAGAVQVAPDDSSGGVAVPPIGVPPIAGTGLEVDEDTQLGLTATWMFGASLGVELLAATPFQRDITADLGGLGKVPAGETKHLPPTLSLVWYPVGSERAVKPYVGAGINYTAFFDEDVASELESGAPGVVEALGGPSWRGRFPWSWMTPGVPRPRWVWISNLPNAGI